MKSALTLAVAAGALLATCFTTGPAQADPYKWCAVYSGNAIDGSKGCWFTTLDQCQATVTGLSGWCEPNTFFNEPSAAPGKRVKKRTS